MQDVCGNIKAELATDHNGLTALAQLVAVYTSAGITSVADVAARTGYSERAIRKAKAELGCRNPGATGTPVPEPRCHDGTPVPQTEPECRNPGAASRARIESPSGISLPLEVKQDPPTPKPEPFGVRVGDGTIELDDAQWTFWLEQFGGDKTRLLLALIEIRGNIQVNSATPLKAQVGRHLARIAGDRNDRAKNYAKAVERNQRTASPYTGAVKPDGKIETTAERMQRLLKTYGYAEAIAS